MTLVTLVKPSSVATACLLGMGLFLGMREASAAETARKPEAPAQSAARSTDRSAASGKASSTDSWLKSAFALVARKWPGVTASRFRQPTSEPACRARVRFLNREFRTSAFRKAVPICAEGVIDADPDRRWPQVGISVLEFPTCRALADARTAIDKSKRSAFRLPIATIFRAVSRERALILVSSESVLREDIGSLFDSLDELSPDRAPCTEVAH